MVSKSLQLVMIIVHLSLLTQCTPVVESTVVEPTLVTLKSPYSLTTTAYLNLAENNVRSEETQSWLLLAAGRAIEEGELAQAGKILAQTIGLSAEQAAQKKILLAEIALINNAPKKAITLLSTVSPQAVPEFYQAQYHQILAKAYTNVANYTLAFGQRMKLAPFFANTTASLANYRESWKLLMQMSEADLVALNENVENDPMQQGWKELALIARKTSSKTSLAMQLQQWHEQYPHHPASNILVKGTLKTYPSPVQIALLLPLSGALAGPGKALQEGFIDAANKTNNPNLVVKSYDTVKADVREIYALALKEGANYIVGPLSKNDVIKVESLAHPVPTLVLNDTALTNDQNFFAVSLSPIFEALQIARKAHEEGLKNTLILAPKSVWGETVAASFTNQWQKQGGHVVDTLYYDNSVNLSDAVRNFLHVSKKEAEQKQARLKKDEVAIPKRREDFDMIFLLAYPSVGRQLVPLLKYYFAGDVPVYATSNIYGGQANIRKDKDLNGLIFCEYPQVLAQQHVEKNWPEQLNSYSRLYALGNTSFDAIFRLNNLQTFASISGQSANLLSLNKQNIKNHLVWAQFNNGIAVKK